MNLSQVIIQILYPGDYLIDFAKNIISSNSDLNFENYENISEKLTAVIY